MIGGLPVLGSPLRAPQIAVRMDAKEVLVISGALTGKQLRQLMEDCAQVDVMLKVIPAMEELLSGDYSFQIRDVDIDDLLRREPVQLSGEAIGTLLADRTVLVTGAGGSIGSEICRQVLRFRPRRLVLVERAENNLFLIDQELRRLKTETELFPCIADITDGARMDQILGAHQPAVVFHAAAHKHVPMMEDNPGEAIKNNVLGTKQLVELADRHAVQEFVMISTDKAVNPTSVMGVSKQIAERYVHAFSEVASTKFVVVRFGNVLASAGSVVPIFQEQIRRGGPITVTHPEIERYFMTIPEASQLVLQAAAMGKGGEIFVLDMGESVRIVDLAQDLVRLSGLEPDDIEIVFTGLRPGEKLYEELYFDDEEMLPTPHPKLFVAYHRPYHLPEVNRLIDALRPIVHQPTAVISQQLQELIPEFCPPVAAPAAGESSSDSGAQPVLAPATNGVHAAPDPTGAASPSSAH
jgi:FlaA1/EpsC-like NDP-sugar epimerase